MRPEERRLAEEAVRVTAETAGYEVLRLTISNARRLVLTVDLDPGPVTMDHLTNLNWKIRGGLERAGLPADGYAVEVESPGPDRPLLTVRHFVRFRGERARLKLKEALADGQSTIVGILDGVEGGRIRVRLGPAKVVEVSPASLVEARLAPARSS